MNRTEELQALAAEIMITECTSEPQAYMRAAGQLDALLEYAESWDDDVVLSQTDPRWKVVWRAACSPTQ
jgi:hypothetical protein